MGARALSSVTGIIYICTHTHTHTLSLSLSLSTYIYIYTLSHSTPPMPGAEGCEKLHSPIGLLTFRAHTIFLTVRWLENHKYLNETAALLAPEIQLWCNERGVKKRNKNRKKKNKKKSSDGKVGREAARQPAAQQPPRSKTGSQLVPASKPAI